jgi:RNA polymerase sigma factor (sigma-70 family)
MNSTATRGVPGSDSRAADARVLKEIFSSHHQQLYRYCLAILGDPHDAEDALQNTMLKVVRALPGEKREIALKPWLYRIAHNESIDLIRRRRPDVSLEESRLPVGTALAEQVETRQRLRQLIADVGALPERQRGALLMREAGGLEFEEIAAALETTPAVARQTLYEARLGLREMDAGRELECTAVSRALSDGDGRVRRRRDIRAHLRECEDCRQFAEQIDSRGRTLAAISPLPAVAAAAMLRGLGAGGSGAAGGAVAGAAGTTGAGSGLGAAGAGVAAKSVGTATLLKGAATLAVAAAIGVGGADVGGFVHLGGRGPDQSSPTPHRAAPDRAAASGGPAARASTEAPVDGRPAPPRLSKDRPADRKAARSARSTSSPTAAVRSPSRADPAPAAVVAEESSAGSPGKSAVEHRDGRGHEKQRPASAAHGQETAAANKAKAKPVSGLGAKSAASPAAKAGGAEHPTHPVHPVKPSKPEVAATPAAAAEPAPAEEAAEAAGAAEEEPGAAEPPVKGKEKKP